MAFRQAAMIGTQVALNPAIGQFLPITGPYYRCIALEQQFHVPSPIVIVPLAARVYNIVRRGK